MMERREFLQWVGVGLLASSLPSALVACRPQSTDSTANPSTDPTIAETPRSDGFIPVATVAQLDEAGFVEDKKFVGGSVIVIRDPNNENALIALDSLCTHQGCSVDWQKDSSTFVCPCHDSQFATDGSVTKKPATKPLKTFAAKIDGDLVLVKA